MNDPIADMITRIKNAGAVGKRFAVVPYSKMKLAVAEVLVKEKFLTAVANKGRKDKKILELEISFKNNSPKINGAKRISKFSRRVYLKSKDIKPVKNFSGLLILTTPKGIMTDKEAKKEKIGGEALFEIW
jgi:small subunit ribosomal protein S8